MALDVGTLVASIRVDSSKVGSDVAKGERAMIDGAGRAGDKAGKEAGSRLGGSLTRALKQGVGLAAGYLAFKGVTQFLGDSVRAASDLNETVSKSRNIFGGAAKGVETWANGSAKAFGLSRQASIAAAAQFGDMFSQLGQGQAQAAQTSEKVVKLAADLGSFHNLDTNDVLQRISAGFRGEYDSLQLLIPNISAARVQQEALTETHKKSASQLTANEKATATLAIITKDSKNATGDFARTSGGLANQQKILGAETDNLKAKIGAGLYPVLTATVKFGNNQVVPFLSSFADHVGQAGAAIRPVAQQGATLVRFFSDLPGPVQAATVAAIAFTALRPRLSAVIAEGSRLGTVGKSIGSGFETARLHAMAAGDAFKGAETKIRGLSAAVGYGAKAGARGALSGLSGLLGGPWGIALTAATAAVGFFLVKHQQAKQRVEDLTQAIEADSGALGENTKAALANAIEKTDAVKFAKDLGISLSDLTDSLLHQAAAQDRVYATIAKHQTDALTPNTKIGAEADALVQILSDQEGVLGKAGAAAKDHAALMGQDATATDTAAGAQSGLGGQVDSTTGAIAGQTAATQTWIEKQDAATSRALDARGAQRGFQQALDDARTSLHDNGKTLDITTQKGRDNSAALDGMVSALQNVTDHTVVNGGVTARNREKLIGQRNALIEVAARFFGSRDAAKAYIDKLIKIPPVIKTRVSLSAYDAIRALGVLRGQINKLNAMDLPSAPSTSSANGNIFRYAQGGESHVAQVAPAGAWRVWAEPETGGEAYIPLASSKRGRSLAITRDVANQFGYDLVSRADGAGPGSEGGGAGPSTLILVDTDGRIIERMRVTAQGVVRGEIRRAKARAV